MTKIKQCSRQFTYIIGQTCSVLGLCALAIGSVVVSAIIFVTIVTLTILEDISNATFRFAWICGPAARISKKHALAWTDVF